MQVKRAKRACRPAAGAGNLADQQAQQSAAEGDQQRIEQERRKAGIRAAEECGGPQPEGEKDRRGDIVGADIEIPHKICGNRALPCEPLRRQKDSAYIIEGVHLQQPSCQEAARRQNRDHRGGNPALMAAKKVAKAAAEPENTGKERRPKQDKEQHAGGLQGIGVLLRMALGGKQDGSGDCQKQKAEDAGEGTQQERGKPRRMRAHITLLLSGKVRMEVAGRSAPQRYRAPGRPAD